MNAHPTIYIYTVIVTDPDTGNDVEVEIRKDKVTGAMVGLDCSFLDNELSVRYPYSDRGLLDIPDDESRDNFKVATLK